MTAYNIIVGRSYNTPDTVEIWTRSTAGIYSLTYRRLGLTNGLEAVIGFDDRSIIGAGYKADRYKDGVWSVDSIDDGAFASCIHSLLGYSDGAVWAFSGTKWWRWTGTAWVDGTHPAVNLYYAATLDCCGISALEAWVVGGAGGSQAIYRTVDGGTNWTNLYAQLQAETGAASLPTGIYAISATEIYLCTGTDHKLFCWDGAHFSTVATGMTGTQVRLAGTRANNIWIASYDWVAGGNKLQVWRWNGTTLALIDTASSDGTPEDIAVSPDGSVIVITRNAAVGYESSNGGTTWGEPPTWPSTFHTWWVGVVPNAGVSMVDRKRRINIPRDRSRRRCRADIVPSKWPLGSLASVQRLLDTPLIINGNVGSTILRLLGGQAATGGWVEYDGAGTLTLQAGTAPTYDVVGPLGGGDVDEYVRFAPIATAGYFLAGDGVLGDMTVEDCTIEMLLSVDDSGLTYPAILGKRSVDTTRGWQIWPFTNASNLRFFISDGVTQINAISPTYVPGTFVHLFACYHVGQASPNGSQVYANAQAGTATGDAAIGSITHTNRMGIGGWYGIVNKGFSGKVVFAAIHIRTNWHQAGAAGPTEWAAIAKTRFLLLAGMRALFARGNAEPSSYGSASPCYLSRRLASGATQLFYMGAYWPRFESLRPSGWTSDFVGLLNEPAHTNSCLQSDAMGTTWTQVALTSITANGQAASDGNLTLDGLVGTAVNTQHGVTQAVTMTAVPWCISAEVKAGDKTWVKIFDSTVANAYAYFDITNGVWGTTGAGIVDKWLLYTATGTVRAIGIRVLGTVAAHTCGIYAAQADNDDDFAGDAATVNLWVGKVQVCAADYPSSRINTTTAAVTRAASTFIVPSASNVRLPSGSVRLRFWAPSFTPATRRTLLSINDASANNRIDIFIHTDGTLCAESRKAAGNSGDIALAGSVCDGAVHTVICRWRTTSLHLARDGTAGSGDATADILAAATATQISVGNDAVGATQAGPILISDLRFGA